MTCMTKSGISLSQVTIAHGRVEKKKSLFYLRSFAGSELVVVSAMKSFQCTDCSKRFKTDNGRADHQRAVHCGEPFMSSLLKPYQCTLCPKRFATDNALKSHMRSKTKKHRKMTGNIILDQDPHIVGVHSAADYVMQWFIIFRSQIGSSKV